MNNYETLISYIASLENRALNLRRNGEKTEKTEEAVEWLLGKACGACELGTLLFDVTEDQINADVREHLGVAA